MACVDICAGAGTTLHMSPNLPSVYTATGWAAVSGWVAMGELNSIGEFGAQTNIVEYKRLDGTICKAKGSTNYGDAQIGVAFVADDTGQAALITAAAANSSRSFKVTLNDDTATKTTPTVMYFAGLVSGYRIAGVNDADAIVMANSTIAVNSAVTTVARHA